MRLIHISDLHFGPHFRPQVGEHLLKSLAHLGADALIISGDLTQRARVSQFEEARDFIEKARLIIPQVLVCPGNHDVPLYRFWERWLFPFRAYRRYISSQLDTVTDTADACIVGLNSVRPYRHLVEGYLTDTQYNRAEQTFSKAPSRKFRILVCHHPPGEVGKAVSSSFVAFCKKAEVDLVLSGHSHISSAQAISPSLPTLLVSCGTTTSGRGRGEEEGANTFNVIEGSQHEETRQKQISISSFRHQMDQAAFSLTQRHDFSLS